MQVGGDGYLNTPLECGKSIVIKVNYRLETIFNVISIIFVMIDICHAYKEPCKIYEVFKSSMHETIVPHMFHTKVLSNNYIIYTRIKLKGFIYLVLNMNRWYLFMTLGSFKSFFFMCNYIHFQGKYKNMMFVAKALCCCIITFVKWNIFGLYK